MMSVYRRSCTCEGRKTRRLWVPAAEEYDVQVQKHSPDSPVWREQLHAVNLVWNTQISHFLVCSVFGGLGGF